MAETILYKKLNPTAIKIDRAHYQRELDESRINKILRNWDELQVDPPKISERKDGTFWAMDGQHTLAAWIHKKNNEPILCRIYEGLTPTEEAQYFEKFNTNNQKPNYNDRLKARCSYGEEKAVAYINMLDLYKIPYSFSRCNDNYVTCHHTCEMLIHHYGMNALRTSLLLLDGIYKNYNGRFSSWLVSCLTAFIGIYSGKYDSEVLKKHLEITPMQEIKLKLATYVGIGVTGSNGGMNKKFALPIVDIYNKGLRTKRLDQSDVLKKEE